MTKPEGIQSTMRETEGAHGCDFSKPKCYKKNGYKTVIMVIKRTVSHGHQDPRLEKQCRERLKIFS